MTDLFSEPVFWTGLLGLAGILATFFAPNWSSERIEAAKQLEADRRAHTQPEQLDDPLRHGRLAVA